MRHDPTPFTRLKSGRNTTMYNIILQSSPAPLQLQYKSYRIRQSHHAVEMDIVQPCESLELSTLKTIQLQQTAYFFFMTEPFVEYYTDAKRTAKYIQLYIICMVVWFLGGYILLWFLSCNIISRQDRFACACKCVCKIHICIVTSLFKSGYLRIYVVRIVKRIQRRANDKILLQNKIHTISVTGKRARTAYTMIKALQIQVSRRTQTDQREKGKQNYFKMEYLCIVIIAQHLLWYSNHT